MKINLYYMWQQYDWEETGRVTVSTVDTSDLFDYLILLKIIEIEAPDIANPTREKIIKHKTAKLEEDKKKLMAETQLKINVIEDKIRQLQAIEFKE